MYTYAFVHVNSAPVGARRGVRTPEAGITGSYQPPAVGAGD